MKKTILALGLLGAFTVSANPFVLEGGSNASGNSTVNQSNTSEGIALNIQNASSQYFDVNGNGGFVDVGDVFFDVGTVNSVDLETTDGGFGQTWQLNADYGLYGVVVQENAGDPLLGFITGGFVNLYYEDLTDNAGCTQLANNQGFCSFVASEAETKQVMSIAVTGSSGPINTSVGINIDGVADYGFADASDPFVQNFFNVEKNMTVGGTTSTNLYDLYAAGFPTDFVDLLSVSTLNGSGGALPAIETLNYGTAPTSSAVPSLTLTPFEQQIYDGFAATVDPANSLNSNYSTVSRGGELLSANVTIRVPEPGSLAVFSLGLLGLAFGRKIKRK